VNAREDLQPAVWPQQMRFANTSVVASTVCDGIEIKTGVLVGGKERYNGRRCEVTGLSQEIAYIAPKMGTKAVSGVQNRTLASGL
jgi:hypothetical protein